MDAMLFTAETSHFDRSALKADVPKNMDIMLVTADTSHFERSALNSDLREKMNAILVLASTSQSPIGPWASLEQSPIGELSIHSSTASRSWSADSGLNAPATSVGK